MAIDPTAKIGRAKIHKTAKIHAYAIIGDHVEIGKNTIVESHAVIKGPSKIGDNNHIYSFVSIGGDPQDTTYKSNQKSSLIIGDNNLIREFCTINRGTEKDKYITKIGSNNMLMSYVHIAHDCIIGDNIIMVNNSSLAGHVQICDYAVLCGFTTVKQHCVIGEHVYIGMCSQVNKDIPHYMLANGCPTRVRSINNIGLKRRNFNQDAITSIKEAFRVIYRESNGQLLDTALNKLANLKANNNEVMKFIKCIRNSKNGIMRSSIEE